MPAVTIYLSRLIGIVMLIVALAMMADRDMVLVALGQLGIDRTPLLLLGFMRVVIGAAIVLVHNIWSRGFWPLVVTLTGWAILVRGVMVLFLPPDAMAALLAATHVVDFYYLYAAIPLVAGVYLTLRGFSASAPLFESSNAGLKTPSTKTPAPTMRPQN